MQIRAVVANKGDNVQYWKYDRTVLNERLGYLKMSIDLMVSVLNSILLVIRAKTTYFKLMLKVWWVLIKQLLIYAVYYLYDHKICRLPNYYEPGLVVAKKLLKLIRFKN